jgi:hypothetical protein
MTPEHNTEKLADLHLICVPNSVMARRTKNAKAFWTDMCNLRPYPNLYEKGKSGILVETVIDPILINDTMHAFPGSLLYWIGPAIIVPIIAKFLPN